MSGKDAPIPVAAAQAVGAARHAVRDALFAAYLHGSAVAGGLRPDSDVDVLVIVARPTTPAERRQIVAELMQVSSQPGADEGRPIELTILHRDDIRSASYPRRAELIYGEWLRPAFEAGLVPEPGPEPDLSLLLAQARQIARTLAGPDAAGTLPRVAMEEVRHAIADVLPALIATLDGDERNVLLTLTRMWRTLETGDFVPKDVAAAWAIPWLPRPAAEALAQARAAYLGLLNENRPDRKQVRAVAADLRDRVAAML